MSFNSTEDFSDIIDDSNEIIEGTICDSESEDDSSIVIIERKNRVYKIDSDSENEDEVPTEEKNIKPPQNNMEYRNVIKDTSDSESEDKEEGTSDSENENKEEKTSDSENENKEEETSDSENENKVMVSSEEMENFKLPQNNMEYRSVNEEDDTTDTDTEDEYDNMVETKLLGAKDFMSSTFVGETSSGKRVSNFRSLTVPVIEKQEEIIHSIEENTSENIKETIFADFAQEIISLSDSDDKENISGAENIPTEEKNVVSNSIYNHQKDLVLKAKFDVQRAKNLIQTLNLKSLPDKGVALQNRLISAEKIAAAEEVKFTNMICDQHKPTAPKPVPWFELAAESSAVQPKTFGKQAMATHNLQKALTMDRLQQLHGSLKACPDESIVETDPRGLKLQLMHHQRQALAWLMWRENQEPAGGMLVDDMGLGKTLTMISLILKCKEREDEDEEYDRAKNDERCKYKYKGGTLVVCPGSLLGQWEGEVQNRLKRGLLSTDVYHGPKREGSAKRLSMFDMVITTYAIVMNEADKQSPLFKTKWKRIILDEAHQVRNHKSQTSEAVCKLSAYYRWILTGTPIHNKELDLFALLKFLRCSPFDDLAVFKKWASSKAEGGTHRLNTVMSTLMLRRTKAQLQINGSLMGLPERQWEIITIEMNTQEKDVYEKVLLFSQSLLCQYLHQSKERQLEKLPSNSSPEFVSDKNAAYYKMFQKLKKTRKIKTVQQSDILVLLLRLRQICCHPTLILQMLEKGEVDLMEDDKDDVALNLLEQMKNLDINDEANSSLNDVAEGASNEPVGLAEATRSVFNPNNPIFNSNNRSSKVDKAIKIIEETILPKNDKCIVVSQWTGFLSIIAKHLKEINVSYLELTGKIPVNKRSEIVNEFNNKHSRKRILLLSLTAGGVGLNLVGANHLLLLDIHWNPQLEMQAQDRIYRMGQMKPVFIYKLMTINTIEERINNIQDKKKEIAEAVLTGAKIPQNKLSLDDLRMIFNM